MSRAVDVTGQTFGRLYVLSRAPDAIRGAEKLRFKRYNCRCECGTEKVIDMGALRSGTTKSCGCFRREINAARSAASFKRMDPEGYRKRNNMRLRIYYKNNIDYCRMLGRASSKRYRKTHLEKCRAADRINNLRRYYMNPEAHKAQSKAWSEKNPDKRKVILRRYYKANKKLIKARASISKIKGKEKLSSGYIRQVIARHSSVKVSDIPPSAVALKRSIIKLKRIIRARSVTA